MKSNTRYTIPIILFFCGIFFVALVLRSQTYINSFTDIAATIQDVEQKPIGLVFGGGVKPNGQMSDALTDRVIKGIELYHAGKVSKLIMTGDNGSRNYDEVTPMKAYAMQAGVPEEDIVLDYAGFRTYESCYRARDIFGVTSTIAVSQAFHLPRILYICNTMGIDTTGYIADRQQYISQDIWAVREFLAKFKAWYQVELTKPLPRFLGPKETVF